MTDQPKWLGVPAVDGARVWQHGSEQKYGWSMFLSRYIDTGRFDVRLVVSDEHGCSSVPIVGPLTADALDSATRAWLSSLAALLGPAELPPNAEPCYICDGTGRVETVKLTPEHEAALDEAERRDEAERAHLEEGAELLLAFGDARDSYELKARFDVWLAAERKRRS